MHLCTCIMAISQLHLQLVSFPEHPVTRSFRFCTQPDCNLYVLPGFFKLRTEPGRIFGLALSVHIHQAAGNLNLSTQGTQPLSQPVLLLQRGITLL